MIDITPPSKTYNYDAPITREGLHAIAQDMRYTFINVADRSAIQVGAFSLEWMGMYGLIHIVYCRDKTELDSIKLRLRASGFDGEFIGEAEAPPSPPAKKTRK